MEPTISQDILKWVEYVAYFVAAASAICKAAEWFYHALPTHPKHEVLDKIANILLIIQQILRIPALNPKILPPVEEVCDDGSTPRPKPPQPKEEEKIDSNNDGNIHDY